MDPATQALIISLLAEEHQLPENSNTNTDERAADQANNANTFSFLRNAADRHFAFELHAEELAVQQRILADTNMARSISNACRTDGQIVQTERMKEIQAVRDRQTAVRMAGVNLPGIRDTPNRAAEIGSRPPPIAGPTNPAPPALTPAPVLAPRAPIPASFTLASPSNTLKRTRESAFEDNTDEEDQDDDNEEDNEDDQNGTAMQAPQARRLPMPFTHQKRRDNFLQRNRAKKKPKTESRDCVICMSNFGATDLTKLPCEHETCDLCLTTMFEAAAQSEGSYPPKCCKPVPLDEVKNLLDAELVKLFAEKSLEWETKDRTYCYEPKCSTFIPPQKLEDGKGTCSVCSKVTCGGCKRAAHEDPCGEDNDKGIEELKKLVAKEGWQKCKACGTFVELTLGCNHMTCFCRHQFCYVCGEKWKNCACLQWDEPMLYDRAERNRDINQPEGVAPEQARRVYAGAFNCAHGGLRKIRMPGVCMECRYNAPFFLMRCRPCGLAICKWCSQTRARQR